MYFLRALWCFVWTSASKSHKENDFRPAAVAVLDQPAHFSGRIQLGWGGSSNWQLRWVCLSTTIKLTITGHIFNSLGDLSSSRRCITESRIQSKGIQKNRLVPRLWRWHSAWRWRGGRRWGWEVVNGGPGIWAAEVSIWWLKAAICLKTIYVLVHRRLIGIYIVK